jgi:hypothetical protein
MIGDFQDRLGSGRGWDKTDQRPITHLIGVYAIS